MGWKWVYFQATLILSTASIRLTSQMGRVVISPSSPAYNMTGIAEFSVSSPTESNQHMFPIITCTRYVR